MGTQPMQDPHTHRDRVLAIDHSALIHRLLKAHLGHERIDLHGATSGREGLMLARSIEPDAILLDIDIKDDDGFALLRTLKSEQATQNIPVIILSGSCAVDDRVRALDMGAIDFIAKPFEIAELQARVRSALRMTHLITMLAKRARLDGLTGLWNRAYFDERLEQEVAEACRQGTDLALAMFDIDHFKQVNDEHGHPFGDHVLELFAGMLSANRITDVTCRYGGEEFVLIAPQTNAESAVIAVERVRDAMKSHQWLDRPGLHITVSAGVSDLTLAQDPAPLALLRSADRALYRAKRSGRNRVCIDTSRVEEARRRSA